MSVIRSWDNPRVRRWRKLATSRRARRSEHRALIEGVHLVSALLASRGRLEALLVGESALAQPGIASLLERAPVRPVVLSDSLFDSIADAESPVGIAAEIALPKVEPDLATCAACVFLEGVQDAGNVGAILRSAAAFAIDDVVLGPGCADAWSPKALRAGMGAHFALRIGTRADLIEAFERFSGTIACTVVRDGLSIAQADLRGRVGWLFGGEGQGVSAGLASRATLKVTIPMPGGAESLNVAAAAAICFYERSCQIGERAAGGTR